MNEIVGQILQTEKKVEEILQKARQEAQDIKQKAERDASLKVGKAHKQASLTLSSAIENARKESQRLKDEKLKKADEEGKAILEKNRKALDDLIQDIVRLVIQTEYSGKET
jgi:vacuolar-type H+-ATPase subunit H